MSDDLLPIILWALGFGLCCGAGVEVHKRVKKDPYSEFSTLFVALAGFGVFPFINYMVASVAIYMLYGRGK